MRVRIVGNGIDVSIEVNDAIDHEIVMLAIKMADRRKHPDQLRLFKDKPNE